MDRQYVRQPTGRNKGRFCKKNIAEKKEQVRQLGLSNRGRKRKADGDGHLTPPPPTRRRVVELSKLGEDLWCTNCDTPLSLRNVIGEVHYGVASCLTVTCQSCRSQFKVDTCKASNISSGSHNQYDINVKLALGMIDAGIGPSQLCSIFSTAGIPPPSETLLKRHERVVGKALEKQAAESCTEAISLEKSMTVAHLPTL
ncbi:hypothetical protein FOCC_FOCC010904 [Frankliniella occidentalis]|nr:hypothetical protein FOCC_FOCC010904 [Frankliniella occidentalis]